MPEIRTIQLACGAVLVAEPMAGVASAAMGWYLPAGSSTDPPDAEGHAALLSELLFRGAGDRDSRGLSDAFDRLGVQRSSQVLRHHLLLTTVMLADRVKDATDLVVDMIRRPVLTRARSSSRLNGLVT